MTLNTLSRKVPWIEDEEDRVWSDDDSGSNWDFVDDPGDNDNSDDFGVDDDIDEDSVVWGGYDKLTARESGDGSDEDDDDYTFHEGPSWKNFQLASFDRRSDRDDMGYLEKPSRVNRKRFSNKRRRR